MVRRNEVERQLEAINLSVASWVKFAEIDESLMSDEESEAHIDLLGFINRLSSVRFLLALINQSNDLVLGDGQVQSVLTELKELRIIDRMAQFTNPPTGNVIILVEQVHVLDGDISEWWSKSISNRRVASLISNRG